MDLPQKRVEEFLHQRIPLAKALNCQVTEASDKAITLSAPKFVNTVADADFSDLSAISLCHLATWTFLQVSLQRLNYKPLIAAQKVVLTKSREIDVNAKEIQAVCQLPGDKEWQQFLRMLSRKARASLAIAATLSDELGETATLTCEYDARDLDPA